MGANVATALHEFQRDVLATAEARQPEVEAARGADAAADGLQMVQGVMTEGTAHLSECRGVVHEEQSFAAVDWPAVRKWVRHARGMTAMFRLPPEQQARIMRS